MACNVSEAEQAGGWDWSLWELQQALYILILIVLLQFLWDFTPRSGWWRVDWLNLQNTELRFFETSVTIDLSSRRNTPEDFDIQYHRW